MDTVTYQSFSMVAFMCHDVTGLIPTVDVSASQAQPVHQAGLEWSITDDRKGKSEHTITEYLCGYGLE